MTDNLSTQQGRELLATQIEDLVRRYGYSVERAQCIGPRCIRLQIEASGVMCSIDLDGDSWRPDTHIIPWHTKGKFSQAFGVTALAEVNPYHRGKCTAVVEGSYTLLLHLERIFALVARGEALMGAA